MLRHFPVKCFEGNADDVNPEKTPVIEIGFDHPFGDAGKGSEKQVRSRPLNLVAHFWGKAHIADPNGANSFPRWVTRYLIILAGDSPRDIFGLFEPNFLF